jgi:hypothetical protein
MLLLTGSPDRVSTLSHPGTRPGIRPVIQGRHLEEAATRPGFPLPFGYRRSLLGYSDSRRGVGLSSRSAYRTRPRARPDPDGVTAFRTHELRPGWVPPIPRGRRCSSRTEGRTQPAPAAPRRLVLAPRSNIHLAGLRFTRHQRGFKPFTRPVFPLPAATRMERAAAWAFPRGFRTPPTGSRRRTPGVGTGHRARIWNNALRHQPNLHSCVFTRLRATSRRTVRSASLVHGVERARKAVVAGARSLA